MPDPHDDGHPTTDATTPDAAMRDAVASGGRTPPAGTRTALVTGAARRIGREIALGLARAGWDVAVHCAHSLDDAHETAAAVRALGRRAHVYTADLADESQTTALFAAVDAALGPVRCLVNNASRFEHDAPADFRYDALLAHAAPNLAAPMLLARLMHASLAARGERGVVVNLLDQKLANLNPDFLSYTVTKAGLLAATTMLAMAFAPVLRVVGVSPGITLVSADQTKEGFARAHARTPLGRSSTPADVAGAVVYLADAPAVTGINLVVDGGQHLQPLARDVMFLAP